MNAAWTRKSYGYDRPEMEFEAAHQPAEQTRASGACGQAARIASAAADRADVTSLAARRWPTSTEPMLLENCPVAPWDGEGAKAAVEASSA